MVRQAAAFNGALLVALLLGCAKSPEQLRSVLDETGYISDASLRAATISACTSPDATLQAHFDALPACNRARSIDRAMAEGWKPVQAR